MKFSYIGITGFQTNTEVRKMLTVFAKHIPVGSKRRLHVGVMTSYKIINDLPTKFADAYAPKNRTASIFVKHPLLFNVLHYVDYHGIEVLDNLLKATKVAGKNVEALQLDMVWPHPRTIRAYRKQYPHVQIILQVGRKSFEMIGNSPYRLVKKCAEYDGAIDFVLLDKSMGEGLHMDAETLLTYVIPISTIMPSLGIVVAGGLGPDTVNLVEPIVKVVPEVSIDAEGKLRPSGSTMDPIDWDMAERYLIEAIHLLH